MLSVDRLAFRPLDDAATAQEADRFTIDTVKVPGIALMEHAGRATLEALRTRYGPRHLLILCGPGNNGGDGYVIARHAKALGHLVDVLVFGAPKAGTDAARAKTALDEACVHLGFDNPVREPLCRPLAPTAILAALRDDTVIVDALFGTGLRRPLGEDLGALIDEVYTAERKVVAVDIPSGLYADGRKPDGPFLRADLTVTYGRAKIAHVAEPSAANVGHVEVADAGILHPLRRPVAQTATLGPPRADGHAPSGTSHKGSFGHVGVLVGAPGTKGAAFLAARAALRAGAGKVSLLSGETDLDRPAELMVRGPDQLEGLTALVIGPGLSTDASRQKDAARLLAAAAAAELPVVLDADGLRMPHALPPGLDVVVTPHPGEAAAVLGISPAAVQRDRMAAASRLVEHYPERAVVVLKGAAPIIAARDAIPTIVPGMCPALAVGGSGDVLSGVVAACLDVGPAVEAAILACCVHQAAGAALSATMTRGHLAGEIADAVGPVVFGARGA